MMPQLQTDHPLYGQIADVLVQARRNVRQAANTAMVHAYWHIGRLIVEDEQQGERRAEYGKQVLKELSIKLTSEFGKGFTERNLRSFREFYQAFPIWHAVRAELSWTHYRSLLSVKKEEARQWYLDEAVAAGWSARALDRQISTLYFERHLASPAKTGVRAEASEKTELLADDPRLILKDPYILDFLGLPSAPDFSERDLETAIIDHLQHFLLEMGRGFAFVARQRRLAFDNVDHYVDLVFYHIRLKCYVLIDLKIGKLTFQDVGQMDGYRRMFDDLHKGADDKPTLGIVLCAEKNEAVVRYSVLKESEHLFASQFLPHLPSEAELKALIEQDQALIEQYKAQEVGRSLEDAWA